MFFLIRWLFAFVLLAATYNPTPYNFVRWAPSAVSENAPLVAITAVVLVIAYVVYIRATLRSIGPFGMVLVAALVFTLGWALHYYGILTFEDPTVQVWAANVSLSVILGVGLSWSIIRRRITGQIDMDDVDDGD